MDSIASIVKTRDSRQTDRDYRMLYLYRGWNSGTNQAVLNSWRIGSPEVEIDDYDINKSVFPNLRSKLRGLPHALRRGGIEALLPGKGHFGDSVKRSAWYMKQLATEVDRLERSKKFDFSLAIGTVIQNHKPKKPYFIYTDLTMRANAYYPEGSEKLDFWKECIPYEEETLKKASMVFTMSEHVSRSLVEQYGLSRENVLRVNGGCNVPQIEKPEASRFERKNVLFVGVQWELKGGPQLVKAFNKIRKLHPNATLTIVGCTPKISGPGIEVVGQISQKQVPKYLARASCFCMVSRREAFGIAYIEAMHAGLPIIAADLGAATDFVIDGQTGYRVNPDDINTLAERIDELISDPNKCRYMGEQAKKLAQSQYTWEKTQQKMWQAIRNIVE